MTTQILILFIVLFISVVFLSFDFILVYLNKQKSETEKKDTKTVVNIISILAKDQKQFVSTMLFGGITSMVLFCYLYFEFLQLHFTSNCNYQSINVLIIVFVAFIIQIVFGFLVPTLFLKFSPSTTLNILSLPLAAISVFTYPIIKLIFELSWLISKVFIGKKTTAKNEIQLFNNFRTDEIEVSADHVNEIDSEMEHDVKIFQNALAFSKVRLRECAIPRNEIEAVELNTPIEKLKERFIETGFSKILVYQDSIDNIIGYAQSNDIFRSPESILPILRSLVIVPETMPANKLLNLFLKEHKSIALVVDEFGGTYGMATLEDIMEEIFGEIEDEHDSIDLEEEKISDYEYIFSGRLEIDYINEKYNLHLPESEAYATIAGFILNYNEEIPKENDKIRIDRFELEILKLHNPKIELVRLMIHRKS